MITKNLRFFLNLKSKYKFDYILLVISLIGSALTVLSLGFIFRKMLSVDATGFLNQTNDFYFYLVGICSVLAFFIFLRSKSIAVLSDNIELEIKKMALEKVIYFEKEFFDQNGAVILSQQLDEDVQAIKKAVEIFYSFFIRNVILTLGGIALLFYSSWKLSLILFLFLPLVIIPSIFLLKKLKIIRQNLNSQKLKLINFIDEVFRGISVIQIFAKQAYIISNFKKNIADISEKNRMKNTAKSMIIASVIFLVSVIIIMITYKGVREVHAETLASDELISFVFYAIIVGSALAGMSEVTSTLSKANHAATNLLEILKRKTLKKKFTLIKNENIFEFKKVNLKVGGRNILTDISFDVKPGDRLAIIGPSGAGKTSLLNLILGLYSNFSGEIKSNQRQKIAFISQEPKIFSGTIRDNLRFANESAVDEEMINILKATHLFQDLENQEDILNIRVGADASNLSTGQKQRLAIARALIVNPDVLVMDEITSNLDLENEKRILDLIDRLMKNKTILYVTHKLNHILKDHRVLLLNNGSISEYGNSEDLLSKKGLYYQLYKNHA